MSPSDPKLVHRGELAERPSYHVKWTTPLPALAVTLVRSWEPRMCLSKAVYRVTSSPFPLTDEQLSGLEKLGVLGSGQGFRITNREESKVLTPARGYDLDGNEVEKSPVDESGRQYPPSEFAVFTYYVERTCDSGD